jgi:beta-lactamase superfamily II metal-dependent hydrolase
MGHHGSKTSSNDCFIDKIKPSVSLYSSYDPDGTKYGFPSIYSLNRIKNYSHHDIYGSEYNGNINIEVNKNGYIMKDDNNRNLIKTTSG